MDEMEAWPWPAAWPGMAVARPGFCRRRRIAAPGYTTTSLSLRAGPGAGHTGGPEIAAR